MGTGFIIALVVVIVFVLLFFSRVGKDPSKKSNAMLERELALHDRLISSADVGTEAYSKRLRNRKIVAGELNRRVPPSEASPPETQSLSDSIQTAGQIREIVRTGFDEGWRRGKANGQDDANAQETALASGLLNLDLGIDGWQSMSPELMEAMMIESLPFKFAGSKNACLDALIEYAVWREHPESANATLVQNAVAAMVNKMKASREESLLASLRSSPMPWAKLIED